MNRPVAGIGLWRWLALLAGVVLLVVALLVSSSKSAATVADVNGTKISYSNFESWFTASAASAHASSADLPAFVPDAPDYKRCIAFETAAATKQKVKVPSQATLKNACSELRTSLAEGAMQLLLTGQWILDQAAKEHIVVTDAQVQSSLHKQFPKTSGLATYLTSNKLTRPQLEYEVRVELTSQKLDTAHAGPTPTITQTEISDYYTQNKSALGNVTLAQASAEIKQLLIQQKQAPKLDPYLEKLQTYWKARTTCTPGYRIASYCHA